jgi:hypothetical protein
MFLSLLKLIKLIKSKSEEQKIYQKSIAWFIYSFLFIIGGLRAFQFLMFAMNWISNIPFVIHSLYISFVFYMWSYLQIYILIKWIRYNIPLDKHNLHNFWKKIYLGGVIGEGVLLSLFQVGMIFTKNQNMKFYISIGQSITFIILNICLFLFQYILFFNLNKKSKKSEINLKIYSRRLKTMIYLYAAFIILESGILLAREKTLIFNENLVGFAVYYIFYIFVDLAGFLIAIFMAHYSKKLVWIPVMLVFLFC